MKRMKICVVTFCWPPRNSIGAHRPYSWAKYWSQAGADVTVITAKKYAFDAPLDLDLPTLDGVKLIEVDYLSTSSFLANLVMGTWFEKPAKALFKKLRGSRGGEKLHPRAGWFSATQKMIPEIGSGFDFVVSTYDPVEAHLIACEIKKQNPKTLWVADYRDLWSQNHLGSWDDVERAQQEVKEVETVGAYADLLTSISDDLAADLNRLHDKPALAIMNGFDLSPEEVMSRLELESTSTSDTIDIVYTGKIYPGHRDPTPLLEAIADLETEGSVPKGLFCVHFFGGKVLASLDPDIVNRFSANIKSHGQVARDVALEAQKNADLLLLLESASPEAMGVLTGKLFEYISSGKPILSLGSQPGSAIESLITKTKTGVCAGTDRDQIKRLLIELANSREISAFQPQAMEILKYTRSSQALKLLEVIREL